MTTSTPTRRDVFPRAPLLGIFALIGLAVVAAAAGRLAGREVLYQPSSPVAERDLRFEDRADGGVTVTNVATGHIVTVVTGESGFLRGTLRGLARTRRSESIGSEAPFKLTAWADGRLTLDDPSTGRHVDLEAFGETNEAVFVRLLTAKDAAP